VVFILADDLGYTDLACYGSKYYETPNIDRLAAHGMRFTEGYACGPNCVPTRAALMSGQYGARTGVYTVGSIERFNWRSRPLRPVDNVTSLPLKTVTVAQAMKDAGYATGLFGKWHLGQNGEYHPARRGFDEAIVSMGKHFDFATSPKVEYAEGTYLADFLTEKSVDFIRRHKEGPFFLALHHFGVHSPHEAKGEILVRFQDKVGVGGHKNPTYAAMIASLDESVGRVLSVLDELKLAENTLVIFTSDNGGVGGYVREGIKRAGDVTDNAPLRGGKGMLYEGGIRVPYIFRWSGTVKAGTTCAEPINSVDWFPTMVELAGGKGPEGQVMDGVSYVGLLKSDESKKLERDAIYWHFPGYLGAGQGSWRTTPVSVIRSGDFKLMEFLEEGRVELYNVREDVGERENLAEEMPEKARELREKLHAWRTDVKAPMPGKNDEGNAGSPRQRRRAR
jgi:arylsulfatase A-like enzyme